MENNQLQPMTESTLINLDHLRLFTMGDSETEKMMLAEIVSELKAESAKIPSLVQQQEWHSLSRVTHKLKTTLPFIGNTHLIGLNSQMETSSRNSRDLEQIPSWAKQFTDLLPEVISTLEGMI